ncbi:MAG: hypothetical protein ABFD94_22760, partial [Armatimonadia bacterium]
GAHFVAGDSWSGTTAAGKDARAPHGKYNDLQSLAYSTRMHPWGSTVTTDGEDDRHGRRS